MMRPHCHACICTHVFTKLLANDWLVLQESTLQIMRQL